MPLLYGEGMRAFIRLREEIFKSSDDESLFAHTVPAELYRLESPNSSSLLAPSPACFARWGHIEMC